MSSQISIKQIRTGELGEFIENYASSFTSQYSGYLNSGSLINFLATGEYNLNNTVRDTGNQNISGIKNFYSRPTVNGTGVLLSGENTNASISSALVVQTTGYQRITGAKAFLAPIYVGNSGIVFSSDYPGAFLSVNIGKIYSESYTPPGSVFGSTSICISNYDLFDSSNQIHLVNGRLSSGPSGSQTTTLDWTTGQRILSGDWQTNAVPMISNHIVNKGYLDTRLSSLPQTANSSISFFAPYSTTGYTLQEQYVSNNIYSTGLLITCSKSGSGPIHLSSGASGILLYTKLTGSFYQRDKSSTTQSIISNFSLDSGVYYNQMVTPSVTITGGYLVGLNVYSGLSGISNIGFHLLCSGV